MNLGTWDLALMVTAAGIASGAGLLAVGPMRRWLVGILSALSAIAGGVTAIWVLTGHGPVTVDLPQLLPLAGIRLNLDGLGAVFMLAVALVALPASVYGIGYSSHGHGLGRRSVQATYPLFVVSLLLVPMAASLSTLVVLWEAMALTSLVLVAAEHRERSEVREAAWWYGSMSHLSMIAILVALVVFAGHAHGETFEALRISGPQLTSSTRSFVFLLSLIGFGAKAGIVPLHVWLPRAHPEAPSHVSALMSGAMVNLGIYGVLRVSWDLLGGGPIWWGLTVLFIGVISAVFGILHALVARDLKRLLAYSTTENMGLILIGVGAAGVYSSSGNRVLAGVAITAALLHVVNHAAFKALLFLGAGSALTATGTRDLDRMGGLLLRMPVSGAAFAIGSLAIMALPPFNGFVSEWLLLKSLVQGLPAASVAISVTMPIAVGAVALTGGLAAATFVKAFGTGFLARPRSLEAEMATEVGHTMQTGMVSLAAVCIALGLAPFALLDALRRSTAVLPSITGGEPVRSSGVTLHTGGLPGSLSPLIVGGALLLVVALIPAVLRLFGVARTRRVAENWGSGRALQTARMEYTATSFAEPLQRVFDDVLRPEFDLAVTHRAESSYYIEAVRYRVGIVDGFETRLYRPLIRIAKRWGEVSRSLQAGSIHRYLAYMFVALVVVLLVSQ